MSPHLYTVTDSSGHPVVWGWIVRQAFPQATCVDQAHRGAGVWTLPDWTPDGSAEVIVQSECTTREGGRQSERRDTIRWVQR